MIGGIGMEEAVNNINSLLALEKELKTKYGYDDESINRIIDNFLVKVELKDGDAE